MSRYKKKQAYEPWEMNRVSGIALPDKLKCNRCNKYKNHQGFSHKQLTDARFSIEAKRPYKINCRPCTGGQIVELECMMCNKTKGLEEFAKVQRTKPDSARCMDCVAKQVELNPISDEMYNEPRQAFQPLDTSAGVQPEYWVQSSTVSTMSVAGDQYSENAEAGSDREDGSVSLIGSHIPKPYTGKNTEGSSRIGTLIETDSSYSHALNSGGPVRAEKNGWQTITSGSWNTPTGASSRRTASKVTDYHSNDYENERGRSTSTTGSVRTFSSNFSGSGDQSMNRSTFARIKAYKPPHKEPDESDEEWKSESEEEDDDDDDDDYTEI